MFDPFADSDDPRPEPPVAATAEPAVEPAAPVGDPFDAAQFGTPPPAPVAPAQPVPAPPTWSAGTGSDDQLPPLPPMAPPPAAGPPPGRRRSPVLVGLVVLSVALSGFAVARATGNKTTIVRAGNGNSTVATVSTSPNPIARNGSTEPIAAVAAALAPSVVQIETNAGLGSGFIYDSAGHILTAAHVVTGAGDTVTVRLADGTSRTGHVVGSDTASDVAVVKVDLSGTKATEASLAVGDPLQVGQTAVAIGSPFGLDQTVTAGIVSAVDRAMQTTNGAIDMVQTDAPINPGNSGGPLADLQGRVIGINDQIESASGSSSGVGFAIPIDTAKAVADKIVAGDPVTFAFLGVQTQDSGQGVVGNGALIVSVESASPAEKGGIQQGDVITKIGSTPIDDSTGLAARIRQSSPGDVVTVTIQRNGSTKSLSITLGSSSAA